MGFFRAVRIGWHAVGFAGKMGGTLLLGALNGTLKTLETATGTMEDLAKGRYEKAGDRIERRLEAMAAGLGGAVESAAQLGEEMEKAHSVEAFLKSDRHAKQAAAAVALGLGIAAGASLLDMDADGFDDTSDGTPDAPTDGWTASLFGLPADAVSNGVFVGDESDLQTLIDAGKDPTSEHIADADIVRNLSVRDAFLALHGFDGVPDRFEVHHVVPLSQGGPDSIDNMILVTEAEHDLITAAHQEYYGWGA